MRYDRYGPLGSRVTLHGTDNPLQMPAVGGFEAEGEQRQKIKCGEQRKSKKLTFESKKKKEMIRSISSMLASTVLTTFILN